MFVRWLDRGFGREAGTIEENDDDLCRDWIRRGLTAAATRAEWEAQHGEKSAPEPQPERAIEAPPQHRSMRPEKSRRK